MSAQFRVSALRTEYQENPVGIDVRKPRLYWKLVATEESARGVAQSAWRVQVALTEEDLVAARALCWDSGKVMSDVSVHLEYAGEAVRSATRYYWRVQAWDSAGEASAWSEIAFWEMGLLEMSDWRAQWITPDLAEDPAIANPSPLLRTTFTLPEETSSVQAARIYVTSLGLYELELNGARVSDAVFTPGWTSYNKQIQYQTWDVTEMLRAGENALGARLGDGWYRGNMGWQGHRNHYGDKLALLLQLEITQADGSKQIVTSNTEEWRAATGAILESDFYDGETYDARLEQEGWSAPAFDDSSWAGVLQVDHGFDTLVAQLGAPVRRQEELAPQTITTAPDGETVLDLGQNMVGWVRLRVRGKAGDVVKLRFAEALNPDGTLYVTNLRGIRATDIYTLRGDDAEEVWEPRFTYHGFRYVGVSGYPGEVTPASITGIVVHSDLKPAGSFACSNPLLNQLQHNIVWGLKGNFIDVPLDCPQRNERLGWTADTQVFARTASFNVDAANFYTRWLRTLALDQKEDGAVPWVVPDVIDRAGATAWGDAATIVPWTLYLTRGDTRILEQQYASMVAWVHYMLKQGSDRFVWRGAHQFGDWVAVQAQDDKFPNPVTSYEYLNVAHLIYSTELLARMAHLLGNEEDALHFGALLPRMRQALHAEFVSPAGRIDNNTQTDYVLALHFDLLPVAERAAAAARLADEVRRFDNHLSTGFVGTPYLCHVLARFGYLDLAYAIVEQETWPSWLYTVKMGGTTMWERWDSIRPDGSFGDARMNSFNHYAYGAIGDWFYEVAAGIKADPATPGYKRVLIAPKPGGSLTSAQAAHDSLYGTIESAWRLEDGKFTLDVTIPPNSEGVVHLPADAINAVTESGAPLGEAAGVRSVGLHENEVVVTVGSGSYSFAVA